MEQENNVTSIDFNSPELNIRIQHVNQDIIRLTTSYANDAIPERNHGAFSTEMLINVPSDSEIQKIIEDLKSAFKISFSSGKDYLDQRAWEINSLIRKNDSFYGLGDKPLILDLRGRKLVNWGTDTYAYPYAADPLYKNIPFFIKVSSVQCQGIFINNTYKLNFDFGSTSDQLSVSSPGGMIDLFIIPGSSPIEIISKYTLLTGTPELPPLWALGYHQSRWSYVPEDVISGIAVKFRQLNIPCDCLYLDIDYMDGYRVFTWDHEKFPNPPHLINGLKSLGFKTVAIIDPGIKIDADYLIYVEGMENDYFVKDAEGENFIGPVWPGYCHFPDFTMKSVRKWWADHVANLYSSDIDGVWNDMNEPALFNKDDMIQTQRTFDDDVIMDFDGSRGLFTEGHNIYGMRMSEATLDGAKQIKDKRPFVLTRSTYSGGQKYASVWTGDNVASWEHLRIANFQCQMLSISGFSFTGSDVGGFVGNPDGELYTRWLQLALFHPFFRTHSSKDFDDQEPWSYGEEWTDRARSVIEWRYKLLGYIYNALEEHVSSGVPILRPLSLVHWQSASMKRSFDQFYFGSALLVVPVLESKQSGSWVDLPEGDYYCLNDWKHFEGGALSFIKNQTHEVPALLIGGHILPVYPVMQYSGEKPLEHIDLYCGYSNNKDVVSSFYVDENDGFNYKEGQFQKININYNYSENELILDITSTGNYLSTIQKYTFRMVGFMNECSDITFNGEEISFQIIERQIVFSINKLNNADQVKMKFVNK